VVADADAADPGANRFDDPGRLVTAAERKVWNRHVAFGEMVIRMTETCSDHSDQDLVVVGLVELNRVHLPLAGGFLQQRCLRLHLVSPC